MPQADVKRTSATKTVFGEAARQLRKEAARTGHTHTQKKSSQKRRRENY
jgi:hypothetical protein